MTEAYRYTDTLKDCDVCQLVKLNFSECHRKLIRITSNTIFCVLLFYVQKTLGNSFGNYLEQPTEITDTSKLLFLYFHYYLNQI